MTADFAERLRDIFLEIQQGRMSRAEADAAVAAIRAEVAPQLRLRQGEAYLRDHSIAGEEVVVGVTFAALAARRFFSLKPTADAVRLRRLLYLDPIAVPSGGSVELRALMQGAGDCTVAFRRGSERDWQEVASCRVEAAEAPEVMAGGVGDLAPMAAEELYRANPHVVWGPSFMRIAVAHASEDRARVGIEIPPGDASPVADGTLDPRVLNGVLFAAFAILTRRRQVCALLPLSVGNAVIGRLSARGPFSVEARLSRLSSEILVVDADIFDAEGKCVGSWRDFSLKRMARERQTTTPQVATQIIVQPTADAQTSVIRDFLGAAIARVLGRSVEDGSRNLLDLGMDSRGLVSLAGEIGRELSIEFMPTLFFEHPSLDELISYFSKHYADVVSQRMKQAAVSLPEPLAAPRNLDIREMRRESVSSDAPIAVIGMAGRMARSADLDAFWRNLAEEQPFITEVPPERWNVADWYHPDRAAENKAYCKWGSFIDGIAEFDPLFFNISPQQAMWLDPQVRHLLEAVYHAAEDAGCVGSVRGSRTGVYAGVCFQEYWDEIIRNGITLTGHEHPSSYRSSIAAHISYALDLRGPSLPIDSACASSLSALHLACQAIRSGECDMAFACGTNLLISPLQFVYFSRIQAMSPTGRCHTFDARADGFVPGEGAIALLLKPLDRAERDGDLIHAVIRGSAINHTGRSPNPTAPRPDLQTEVLRTAWARAGILPRDLSYIECHGTGTRLGDPIEVNALRKAFGEVAGPEGHCVIGSVKAHVGHLEGAAGLAGIVHVVKAMQHATLPRMPEFHELNPMIRLDGSPFRILRESEAWQPASGRRIAGVSGFGMTGNGAHVVIEEYEPPARARLATHGPQLIVLSAKDDVRLRDYVAKLRSWLDGAGAGTWLPDIAHTLQVGREAFDYRLSFIANDHVELRAALDKFLVGGAAAGLRVSRVVRNAQMPETLVPVDSSELETVVDAWHAGSPIDWRSICELQQPAPRRIALPGYAFARETCWFTPPQAMPATQGNEIVISHARAASPSVEGLAIAPVWREKPLAGGAPISPGRSLIVAPRAAMALAEAIATRCAAPTILVAEDCATSDALTAALPPMGSVDALFFLAGAGAPDGLDAPAQMAAAQAVNELLALRVFKALGAARGAHDRTDVFVLIPDCFAGGGARHNPAGAGVCGLGYSLAQSEARFSVRNIDLALRGFAPSNAAEMAEVVSAILREPPAPRGDLVRHAGPVRYRRHFAPVPLKETASPAFRRGGVYVLVGGAGAVGKVITRWLLSTWQARVVWVGRSPEADMAVTRQTFAELGGVLDYIQADATDVDAFAGAMDKVRSRHGAIHGALYAPVVFAFANGIMETDEKLFLSILDVKTRGSIAFAQALRNDKLDFLCFFSSSQAFAFSGAARLSAYAAGICFADSFAAALAGDAQYPVGVINWGFWRAFTQTKLWQDYQAEHPQAAAGRHIGFLEDDEGIACFARFIGGLRAGDPRQIACLRQSDAVAELIQLSSEDVIAETVEQTTEVVTPLALRTKLAELLGEVLRLPPERLDAGVPFAEYGIDSIATAAYVSRINAGLGCTLSATALYDHPTLEALSAHVTPLLAPHQPARRSALHVASEMSQVNQWSSGQQSVLSASPDAVAVIGISLEIPGAHTPDEAWVILRDGCSAAEPIPPWRVRGAGVGQMRAGILARRDLFDPLFFHISPREAEEMSPYQRIALQEAWRCIEDGGYNPKALAETPTGVFFGAEPASFARASLTGGSDALIAARISYFLNLQGPALVVNTGCSSSAVAIHLACESLRRGETRMALAGGIFADVGPEVLRLLSGIGMLSPSGVCRPFDAEADGTVLAEGAAMVLLKPLRDALVDGDPIRGIILSTAMNQDGASNGITAPNGRSQEALLRKVYGPGGLEPASVSYVEAHGTGTILGDPVEVNALSRVFAARSSGRVPEHCRLGSVKATVGHTSAAAGAIGLIKLLLALEHRSIPGVPGFRRLNPKIEDAGWKISADTVPWDVPPGQPRRGALNSFGHSGTNVHMVVEEAGASILTQTSGLSGRSSHLVPLSARGTEQLRLQVTALLRHLLERRAEQLPLASVAWTLQSGRMPARERLVFQVQSIDALKRELALFLDGVPSATRWQGTAEGPTHQRTDGDDPVSLAALWVSGGSVEWERVHAKLPRRLNLPTSAFAENSYPAHSVETATATSTSLPRTEHVAPIQPVVEDLLRLSVWRSEPLPTGAGTLAPGAVSIFCTAAARPFAEALRHREVALGSAVSIIDLASGESLPDLRRAYVLPWPAAGEETMVDGNLEASALKRILDLRRRVPRDAEVDLFAVTRHATPAGGRMQSDAPPPHVAGAGVAGLAYALAQSDHRFLVRNIDAAAVDEAQLATAVMAEPPNHRGNRIRLEDGRRLGLSFPRFADTDTGLGAPFRKGGTYVIAGGAGTVGGVITRFLMREYGARVIWIGRSPADSPRIHEKLTAFAKQGLEPDYVQADVTDAAAITSAMGRIRAKGPIHGAMFSSLVFAFEDTLDRVEEGGFHQILSVKLSGGLNFFRALQNDALDFLCYFSSAQAFAFSGATQFVSYATAMTAADSLCHRLALESTFPLGILNWGFWKSSAENQRLGANITLMSDEEGFHAFSRMVGLLRAGRAGQALALRPSAIVRAIMAGVDDMVSVAPASPLTPGMLRGLAPMPAPELAAIVEGRQPPGLQDLMPRLLLARLQNMGVLEAGRWQSRSELQSAAAILPKYSRWLDEAMSILVQHGHVEARGDAFLGRSDADLGLRVEWQHYCDQMSQQPQWRSNLLLLDACLEALPGILSGRIAATDILFPGGSLERVSGVYSGIPLFDRLNDKVGEAVAFALDTLGRKAPGYRSRIVEIGAGTGGTTRRVLPRLGQRQDIAEYLFTDLSRSFLIRAQEEFAQYEWFRTGIWNIEATSAEAGLSSCNYDIAICTNVLHATRDIATTLRNAKSALKAGGLLLINEITHNDAYGTLTFGLLDGWWLYDDPQLRVPGSPLLSPDTWQQMLAAAGFSPVTFIAGEAGEGGYHVIMASSDGLDLGMAASPGAQSKPDAVQVPSSPAQSVEIRTPRQRVVSRASMQRARNAIRGALCEATKIALADVSDTAALSDYGIDSILGIRFIGHVNEALGLSLNPAVVFEHATVERLSKHVERLLPAEIATTLASERAGDNTAAQSQAEALLPDAASPAPRLVAEMSQKAGRDAIAVIGISGQFPDAPDVETFWRNLAAGHDAVHRLPDDYLAGRTPEMRAFAEGGRLEDRDCFDPLFFAITPREAESMSAHQRLIMQEGWRALEDAAIDPRSLDGKPVGVFVGAEPAGYVHETFSGQSDAIVASRLSYALNLRGPAIAVNTGCSSSGTAIHLACESLRHHQTDLALAGGVCANLDTPELLNLLGIGMLSASGRCKSFSADADGTVMSEAAAVVVLKRLQDALRDGDPIHGVIIASGSNQDGASNGITAPNGEAQEDLIRETYVRFAVDADEITYVETHGTGTALGDVVEANALTRAFAHFTGRQQFCSVASAKSAIGHTSAAAGVTGLIAVLLAMRHSFIPGLQHYTRPNPHIETNTTALSFSAASRRWPENPGQARTAALNCFGHSGTNVHIVVREAPGSSTASAPGQSSGLVLVPLSARNAVQLRESARRLAAALAPRAGADPATGRAELQGLIAREVAASLGVPQGEIPPDESLFDIGLSVEQLSSLRQRLHTAIGPAAKVIAMTGSQSVAALAKALLPEATAWAPQSLDVASVALTLQVGRAGLAERAIFLVSSCEDLRSKLEQFASGATAVEGCWTGRADSSSEIVSLFADDGGMDAALQRWVEAGRLDKLASIWVRGVTFNWSLLHGHQTYRAARRLHLPGYPFARERYRKPRRAAPRTAAPAGLPSVMLHENRSDLGGVRYASHFSTSDDIFAEHRVGHQAVLPAAAAIEMALAAAVAATGRDLRGLVLRHLTWARAIPLASSALTLETQVSLIDRLAGPATPGQSMLIDIKTADGRVWFSTQAAWDESALDEAVLATHLSGATPVVTGEEFYAAVALSGIELGERYRLVGAVHAHPADLRARVAAMVVPPEISAEIGAYLFHPCLIDAALQTVMALEGPGQGPMLPFSLDRLVVRSALGSETQTEVLLSACRPGADAGRFDIVLADGAGEALVTMVGIAMRQASAAEPQESPTTPSPGLTGSVLLAPVWRKLSPAAPRGSANNTGEEVLIAGALNRPVIESGTAELGFRANAFPVSGGESIEDLAHRLETLKVPSHVVWLAPGGAIPAPGEASMVEAQREALLPFFRFAKALIALGRDVTPLAWTIVTRGGAAAVPGEPVNAAHASLHGFIGSLAKEMPEWRFRLLDMGCAAHDLGSFADVMSGPEAAGGEPFALRGGDWFERRLASLTHESIAKPATFSDGVIVVIGGAGGIGAAWSEAMIRSRGARIAWIGRRAEDDAIRAAIARVAIHGASAVKAPIYVQADAADATQLKTAVAQIRAKYGPVRGVVHSAIVLADQTVANMTETQLLAALRPKVDASIAMADAFAGEPLDFVLFFSSVQSFLKMPGQGNYAAGSCFVDAFAAALRNCWACPVKVIDWGYWGNTGIVSSMEYRQRMAAAGMASIEPDIAWQTLDLLFTSTLNQLALMHATAPLDFPALARDVCLWLADGTTEISITRDLALQLPHEGPEYDYVRAGGDFRMEVMEPFLRDIVVAQLQDLGLSGGQASPDQVPALYLRRWLAHTPMLLEGVARSASNPAQSLAQAWAAWHGVKSAWLAEPSRRAQVVLVEAALKELPAILSGERAATAVMLPGASLEMVEQVYTRNLAAQYFNLVLASALIALVNRFRAADPQRPLRILEVGAGTGATSAMLFRALAEQSLTAHVGEYRYTDISHAFLAHAQDKFRGIAPYLSTSRLDIDRPLAEQGLEEGVYDVVIAANSIHTTRDIRRAVRHAKSALRTGGVLLLNEISGATLYGHLTFGLLEGWWLFDEPSLRIPGCPGLSPEAWRQVLLQLGFSDPLFPAEDRHSLGLQIIMAESNGVILSPKTDANPPQQAAPVAAATPVAAPAIVHQASVETVDLVAYLHALLTRLIADATRIPLQEIEAARPFESYGIDSIVVIELAKQLRKVLPDASTTLFFEHQTIAALASHLARRHDAELQAHRKRFLHAEAVPPSGPAANPATVVSPAVTREEAPPDSKRGSAVASSAVAIIGLAGRYPKSPTLEAFWDNLVIGRNCISETPADRWNWRDYYDPTPGKPGSMSTSWGGYIDGIDRFDPLFFGISPLEAEGMNPQERLFLQTAWACIEDAGYTPEGLNALGKVGVYAGVMNDTYHRGAKHWSVANRVSYHCNFHGPSLAVDTACSSSLTALHLAVESLQSGSCQFALVGGVNLITNPQHSIGLSQLRVLSSDDRNKTFSAEADGFVDAEGVGTVLLRPLAHSLAAGDHIHGVILGSALNAGGKVNGYTVPNPHAQAAVVADALSRAGVEPRTISYVEAHGTGTVLGDPIEIGGLTAAFGEVVPVEAFCAIGSVKSNIGHAESAAGMAGLTKILLQMKHRTLVPSLHAQPFNPEINFARSPFRVQTSRETWTPHPLSGEVPLPPLRAGLSSFGAGGANAHVIVEEAPPRCAPVCHGGPCLVVLSAQTAEQLRIAAKQLLERLGQEDLSLADIAFTLQHGRVPLEQRLAVVVSDLSGLRNELQCFLTGVTTTPSLAMGSVKRSNNPVPEVVEAALADGDLDRIARLWLQGAAIDWARVMPDGTARRISLPTYPFAEERCWAPDLPLPAPLSQEAVRAQLPAEPVRRQFVFSGNEDMLRDHRVSGQSVVPGVAYLGLIWQTVTAAGAAVAVTLSDVVWITPFRPEGEPLDLELTPTGEGQGRFAFTSRRGGATVLHCAGLATWRSVAPEQPEARNVMSLMSACRGRRIMPDELQAAFRRIGVDYGTSHLALGPVDLGHEQAFATLAALAGRMPSPLDPGLMDSALQACLCLIDGVVDDASLRDAPLPFRLRRLDIYRPQGPWAFVHVVKRDTTSAADGHDLDLEVLGPSGEVALRLAGLSSRAPVRAPAPPAEDSEVVMNQLLCDLVRHALPDEASMLPFFRPWLAQTAAYLETSPPGGMSEAQLWRRWKARRDSWLADPMLAPRVALMEAAMPAMKQVLTGRRKATDVLFPGGSLSLVEPVYRGNPTADAFNKVLAARVADFVSAHTKPGGVRVLEIGAGTGGTTYHVLEQFRPLQHAIAEYCYTDRSHSFLQHGERQFGTGRPFFITRLLDIERSAEEQDFAPGTYDLVIAANVLHATRDMRATMRNVRRLMRPGAMLALNELSGNALYAHLSFGLLDAWWRYDDAALRIPGSPGLSSQSWERLLSQEGFTGLSFPSEELHPLGQQIILANVERMAVVRPVGVVAPPPAAIGSPGSVEPPAAAMPSAIDRLGAIEAAIRANVARALKIAPHRIENDRSFSDYGVDSILAVNLVNDIAEAVNAPLTTTVIFDYNTVERLALHVLETYPDSVAAEGSSSRHEPVAVVAPPATQTAQAPGAEPAIFDNRIRAALGAFEEADPRRNETVLLLTERPDIAELGERVAHMRGFDLIVAAAPSPDMRDWLAQQRGCRGLTLDGPEFGKRLLAFNQRRKVDHIICDLSGVTEDLSQILRDGGQWLDVG